MDSFCDSIEQISYLARAESRVRVLHRLSTAEPVDRRELCASLSLSRSAVVRAVDSLEERGWVAVDSDGVRLTPVGSLIIEEFLALAESVGAVTELDPFLQWFPLSEHDIAIDDLRGATVTVAADGDPLAPARIQTELLRSTDRFRGLFPSIDLDGTKLVHERTTAGEFESEIVVSPVVEALFDDEPFATLVEEMCATGRHTVHVAEAVPFYLGLADDGRTQIGVEDDEGFPRALLETTDGRVRAWAESLFADYRRSSETLTRL